ncbi:unnamed protein product [Symbiodinium natans]|uniref:Uncharacterized protein n=1 Tax=Symbiodinium natans TaxID=878477 RepID=A0A812PVB5_9DINO|nr:unnamed protein product [Symbiodinium natans]
MNLEKVTQGAPGGSSVQTLRTRMAELKFEVEKIGNFSGLSHLSNLAMRWKKKSRRTFLVRAKKRTMPETCEHYLELVSKGVLRDMVAYASEYIGAPANLGDSCQEMLPPTRPGD